MNKGGFSWKRVLNLVKTKQCIPQVIDVEQVMWSATLDMKTCSECGDLDGKIFDINDPGKPENPLHLNCRCCWMNVPYEGWSPTQRRDNETKEIIPYTTYNKWRDNKAIK